MTFVGKILVVVIVVFSLVFMGMAVTVYSVHTNWRDVAEERQGNVNELQQRVTGLQGQVTSLGQELQTETQKIQEEKAAIENELDQNKTELASLREQVTQETERAENNSRQAESALEEAEDRREEAVRLREQVATLMTEKDDLFRENVDLQTDLFQTTTERDRAESRNQELQVRVSQLESYVISIGGDPAQAADEEMRDALPSVEGLVLKASGENVGDRFVEISIGSDDGLVPGHQLLAWRPGPSPKYLGKVEVIDTDPDRSVARVLSKFRLQRDDNVTSQFK